MAQISYRANLASKSFPLLPSSQGNTVIVPGADQAYTRYGTPGERVRDVNTPEAFYMRNFLPTIEGYSSIGYNSLQAAMTLFNDSFDDSPYFPTTLNISAYQIFNAIAAGVQYQIIEATTGVFYYLQYPYSFAGANYSIAGGRVVTPTTSVELTSYATVAGATYGFFRNLAVPANNTFNVWNGTSWVDAVPLGLALATITGIVGANGYNIAYGGLSIAWSSTTNPVDFVPSLITGAGGASINELQGPIRYVAASSNGFILYTDTNCVSAVYTGNSKFPYKFSDIKGAGGFISQRLIVSSDNLGYQVAFTRAGLQKLSTNTSETFIPELADFIFGKYNEEFNEVTNTFVPGTIQITASSGVRTPAGRLRLLDSRYLVYSYNSTNTSSQIYDYALVYDLELERWGKLKRNHVDIYSDPLVSNSVSAVKLSVSKTLSFLSFGGQTNRLVFGTAGIKFGGNLDTTILPLIIFGRYQYVRSRHLILDSVSFSAVPPLDYVSLTQAGVSLAAVSLLESGVLSTSVAGILSTPVGQLQNIKYTFSVDGLNHSLILKGALVLTLLELDFHIGGKV